MKLVFKLMSYFHKDEWTIERFEKSNAKGKKYKAIIKNKETGKEKAIHFGSSSHQHFKDTTPLKLYKHLVV